MPWSILLHQGCLFERFKKRPTFGNGFRTSCSLGTFLTNNTLGLITFFHIPDAQEFLMGVGWSSCITFVLLPPTRSLDPFHHLGNDQRSPLH